IVLPSTYREGVPRVLIEAAALGKPLVAYVNVGVVDVVKDGYNGFLVPSRDRQALMDALLRISGMSQIQREELGHESRRIAEASFDEKRIADSYIQAIART